MSSLFEVPSQLAVLLLLVANDPAAVKDSPVAPASVSASTEPAGSSGEPDPMAFSEDRWLELLHAHGAETGLGSLANRIFRTRSGVLYVPVPTERAALQYHRRDTAKAFAVARAAALHHTAVMTWQLGRRPSATDLLIAHLSEPRETSALIETAARTPQRTASEIAPRAALAHPGLFFDGVRARSAGEIVRHLDAALERAAHRNAASAAAAYYGWHTVTTPRQSVRSTAAVEFTIAR